jgi:hypothetical protein
VHVDGAWGGYLATLFRNADGSLRSAPKLARNSRTSRNQKCTPPSPHSAAPTRSPSILTSWATCRMAPAPFICRDHRPMALLAEEADYVFDGEGASDYMARYRRLGQFIPEGSKSGAGRGRGLRHHRVLPLDHEHFGMLPRQTVLAAEAFHRRAQRFAAELAGSVHACVPFAPDSNLVCLALNPAGNRDVGRANAFVRRLHEELRCDPQRPLQVKEFFGSMTTLRPEVLGATEMQRIAAQLQLDPETFDEAADRLVILRHTLMNPYLLDRENGISYIDRYFDYLATRVRALA